jgi:glycosyltransferase involved in cell wall biosynthesis
MKILHITGYFNEKVAYQENMLTQGQTELGHSVYVLTSNLLIEIPSNKNNRVVKTGTYDYNGITIVRTPHTIEIKKNSLVYFQKVLKNLIKIKPDYIFVHDKGTYIFSVLFYKIFFNRNMLLRMDFHSDFTNSMNSKFGKYYHFIFKIIFKLFGFAFDRYYYIAPEMGHFINKVYGLPESKCELLRLPGNANHVANLTKQDCRNIWKFDSNTIYFLHSGKLPEGKKTIELIKSINNLDVKLVICGSIAGEKKQILENLIKESSNVEYKGWVNPNELRELIKASDAIIQPGTNSNTFVEAVCIGTPLILANSPYSRDLISFENGVIIENPVTEKGIKEALDVFITDIKEYQHSASTQKDVFDYITISKQSVKT